MISQVKHASSGRRRADASFYVLRRQADCFRPGTLGGMTDHATSVEVFGTEDLPVAQRASVIDVWVSARDTDDFQEPVC